VSWRPERAGRDTGVSPWRLDAPAAVGANTRALVDRWHQDSQVGKQESYLTPRDVLPAQKITVAVLDTQGSTGKQFVVVCYM